MRVQKQYLTVADLRAELVRVYGKDANIFAGRHHARFIPPDVPVHIISRVFQGRYLLRPSKRLNRLIIGIIGLLRSFVPQSHAPPCIQITSGKGLSDLGR